MLCTSVTKKIAESFWGGGSICIQDGYSPDQQGWKTENKWCVEHKENGMNWKYEAIT